MPGVYTEPESRGPDLRSEAATSTSTTNDRGDTGAVSYEYQFHCPNDQNLMAVIGRGPGHGAPPPPHADGPPRDPRRRTVHPLQRPDRGLRASARRRRRRRRPRESGDGAPIGAVKDVGIRSTAPTARVRNVNVRHAASTTSTSSRPTATCSIASKLFSPASTASDLRRGPRR